MDYTWAAVIDAQYTQRTGRVGEAEQHTEAAAHNIHNTAVVHRAPGVSFALLNDNDMPLSQQTKIVCFGKTKNGDTHVNELALAMVQQIVLLRG